MTSFFLFASFNAIVLIVIRYYYKNKFSLASQAAICSFLFYISIIVLAFGTNIYLKYQLQSFDLDKDGFFSIEEQTIEQQRLMREVTSDLGRNLAPITGIFYSIIYFTFLLIGQYFYITIKKIIEKYNSKYQQSL